MKFINTLFFMAIAIALITSRCTATPQEEEEDPVFNAEPQTHRSPLRGISRFLSNEEKNPRGYNCIKDPGICRSPEALGPDCCKNKCVDTQTDSHNCGYCGYKCKYTQACCRGQCVDLAFDKRHCGKCNNRCPKGDYCIYGMCNYA